MRKILLAVVGVLVIVAVTILVTVIVMRGGIAALAPPTETPIPTSTPVPTATPTPLPKDYGSDLKAYLYDVGIQTTIFHRSGERITQLGEVQETRDIEAWKKDMVFNLKLEIGVYEELLRMIPPTEAKNSHDLLLAALKDCAESARLEIAWLDDMKPGGLRESTELLNQCADKFALASLALQLLLANHP